MFNNSRYSLARYSVNVETKTLEITERFSEVMNAVAGVAIPVDVRERYSDVMQGSTRGTISVVSGLVAYESLVAVAKMSANIVISAAIFEEASSKVEGKKNAPAALSSLDNLRAVSRASKNLPLILTASDTMGAAVNGSKDIMIAIVAADTLTALMEATSQTTEIATFQITIPPGGELRIDSENYIVLLDGENALHLQSGDWINVSRELLRLIVESATGGDLDGQLIYTERYL